MQQQQNRVRFQENKSEQEESKLSTIKRNGNMPGSNIREREPLETLSTENFEEKGLAETLARRRALSDGIGGPPPLPSSTPPRDSPELHNQEPSGSQRLDLLVGSGPDTGTLGRQGAKQSKAETPSKRVSFMPQEPLVAGSNSSDESEEGSEVEETV